MPVLRKKLTRTARVAVEAILFLNLLLAATCCKTVALLYYNTSEVEPHILGTRRATLKAGTVAVATATPFAVW